MSIRLAAAVVALSLALPAVALAFPFGGEVTYIHFCYDDAIYVTLSAPRGGPFLFTAATRPYRNGAPTHVGQWLLGLADAPYFCILSYSPVKTLPGSVMTMMGSSQ